VARTPQATPAAIAVRLKLSERTVQRYWPRPDDSVSSPKGVGEADTPDGLRDVLNDAAAGGYSGVSTPADPQPATHNGVRTELADAAVSS
jgi:hypothetical protein